jgi:nitrogen-specific signal transduction histidine kinase/DNA-binding response OmpR family regulator
MNAPLRILFVEDNEDDVALLLRALRSGGFEPTSQRVDSADALRHVLRNEEWDVVISDYSMPRFNGMQALAIHRESASDIPFILVSGTVGEDIAVESIKAGASDYLMKGNLIRFVPAIQRALREAAERRDYRRAVMSLRESQAMLSLIYNNTSDSLILFSVLPDASFRVASVNLAFLDFAKQILGTRGHPSLAGKRLEEIAARIYACSTTEVVRLVHRCDAVIQEARPATVETCFTLPPRRMHVELTLIPVSGAEAHGKHLLWACRDVTTRKECEERQRALEAQLQQAKRLEALGQLAGGIAHDFNNLLTGILGYGELVKAALATNDPGQAHIDQVLVAAHRAKDLVRQILAFSRRERPDRKPIQLEPIVREALDLIRASSPPGIVVESYLVPDLPPILGDATQLHQVLVNLCTNAVQAIGKRGKLSLSLESVQVDAAFARNHPPLREGEFIRLSVSDSGSGISSAAMDHLFEPFFTTKAPGAGTGLGLAVVHGIVRSHEGTISVYSRAGEGTTFQVYFPVSGVLPDSTPNTVAELPRGRGEKILFVDDESGIVNLATTVLGQLGYRPMGFTIPAEALKTFAAGPLSFAAAITDLTMPDMTGIELAGHLQRLQPGLPVMLTTGYSGAIDIDRSACSGFAEILGKPFTMRSLAEALHRVLTRQFEEAAAAS